MILNKDALAKAEAAFNKAESDWLRLGPIHGPDRLEPALVAFLSAPPTEEQVEAAAKALYEYGSPNGDIVPWQLQRLAPLGRNFLKAARVCLSAAQKAALSSGGANG